MVLVTGWRFATFVARAAVRPSACFGAHYTLARLLADGADLARTYDDAWFAGQTGRFTPGVTDINVNPPTTALVLLPLAGLEYTGARIAWTALSLVLLVVTVGWLLREVRLPWPWALGFVALTLAYQPLAANFHVANVYVLLLALATAAWHGYRSGNEVVLGIALGLMLVIKLAGGLLWVLVLSERRWRALAWGAATVATLVLGSLPWVGVGAWRADATALAAAATRPERAVTAYQSVTGLFRHLFAPDPVWNPGPLLDAPGVALLGSWVALLALIGASLWVARLRPRDDRVFAAFVIAGVVASPLSLDYTYTMLLLSSAIAFAWALERRSPMVWVLLAAAVLPVAADLPYRSPRLDHGTWALLAYPKLYGALLLWAGLLGAAWLTGTRAHAEPGAAPLGALADPMR
jgi:hypothetical protein